MSDEVGRKWSQGTALLETSEIIFRGECRLKISLASLSSVVAHGGQLHLSWNSSTAVFDLGVQAEKWAYAILHPKSTAEKLGIKPGLKISAVHMPDDATLTDARKAAATFANKQPLRDSDLIFFSVAKESDLDGIKKLLSALAATGALWIVYPKGGKQITELQVLKAGRAAGLVDIKVVSYSPTLTALKFVRPKVEESAKRPGRVPRPRVGSPLVI